MLPWSIAGDGHVRRAYRRRGSFSLGCCAASDPLVISTTTQLIGVRQVTCVSASALSLSRSGESAIPTDYSSSGGICRINTRRSRLYKT